MKRIIALIMALALVMGLAITASAASITITPPTVGAGATETGITYKTYKIFDATINGDAIAYTIETTSPYYATVRDSGYFTLTKAAGSETTYIVVAKDTYTKDVADTFAKTLKAVSATAAGTLVKQDDGTYKQSNLADGYYLVTSSVGADLILDTIGDISITSKNEYPSLTKTVDATTADMGQELTFTIEVTIPEDASGTLMIHDKMDGLATPIKNVQVSPSGVVYDIYNNPADQICSFEIEIRDTASVAGQKVTITYTVAFNSEIKATNEAWLTYNTYTSNKEIVEILTTDLQVWKVDAANQEMLSGAEFVLAKVEDGKTLYYKRIMAGNTHIGVEWVEDISEAEHDPGDISGHFVNFTNLADGTYLLIETKAPDGYNLLTEPETIIINAAGAEDDLNNGKIVTVTVENSSGSQLPSTGGIGTTLFYVIGGLMMTGAAVLLITKKRMAA